MRKATCCCGQLGITVSGEPAINAVCHCNNCKRRTGSALGWSVYFDNAGVIARFGAAQTYRVTTAGEQERFFCPECGSTVYWTASTFPGMTGIAGGCFTERALPEPEITMANENCCTWIGLPATWRDHL